MAQIHVELKLYIYSICTVYIQYLHNIYVIFIHIYIVRINIIYGICTVYIIQEKERYKQIRYKFTIRK